MQRSETGLLAPYRACGLICSSIPPVYQPLIDKPILGELSCAIDNVVCVYMLKPFRLKLVVSNPLKENISFIAKSERFLFVVVNKSIFVYKNNEEKVFKLFSTNNTPKLLLPCGEKAFVVVDDLNKIIIYDMKIQQCLGEIESPKSFNVSAIVHPIGYVNQIVLGGKDGRMRIIDVNKGSLIQEFPSDNNFNCKITVLVQSTAVDVLGVGMEDGHIYLRNLKLNIILFYFRHEGTITALSFRTDGIDSMISGTLDGSIAIWDLDKQVLVGQKTDAHKGPIVSLNFLLGQSFFISSGIDNKLTKWFLKDEFSLPELVKTIEGPSEPVSSICFTGPRSLLLASRDGCMRQFYAFHQNNSLKQMGIAREVKKNELSRDRFIDVRMEPIVEMQMINTRVAVWDNVICRHENSPLVSTWNTRRFTRGSLLLYHKRFKNNPRYLAAYATSIFLSSCGTFAFIGSSSGHLDVFNMQSGKHRCTFSYSPNSEQKFQDDDDRVAHDAKVTGVAMDMLNQNVVTGAADGSIHFWSFKTLKVITRVLNPDCGGIEKFELNRFNSLLAVAFANNDLIIVDVLCHQMARRFVRAHSSGITALQFSADGKWLVSAGNDCIIKVWDLSTSNLIDVMRCPIACTGISFNETGEYLSTIHKNQRAIYIWANKALFIPIFNNVMLINNSENCCPQISQLPSINTVNVGHQDNTDNLNLEADSDEDDDNVQIVVIDEDEDTEIIPNSSEITLIDHNDHGSKLVSLSGLALSRWANLPQLQLIKDRNKPIEPPKKPENAPFFLSGTDTLEGFSFNKIDSNGNENNEKEMEVDDKENISGVLMAKRTFDDDFKTPWANDLASAIQNESVLLECFNKLKSMNISAIDFQIRSLTASTFCAFLKMLLVVLVKYNDFELVQSYLASFLNIHRQTLWANDDASILLTEEEDNTPKDSIVEVLESLLSAQTSVWTNVQHLIDTNTSLAQWIKSALL